MLKTTLVLIAVAVCCLSVPAQGDVVSRTFYPDGWEIFMLDWVYIELPVELDFGVSDVDSIWVEISGVSHEGYVPIGGEHDPSCWDLIQVRILDEPSLGSCNYHWDGLEIDGLPDCVGNAFKPEGDLEPFDVVLPLVGFEMTDEDFMSFALFDSEVDYRDVLTDGSITFRLERYYSHIYSYKCRDGLADISSVTVHIMYDTALSVDECTWGALKSIYR